MMSEEFNEVRLSPSEEHAAWLFAIAIGEEPEPVELSEDTKNELDEIRATLVKLDRSWDIEPARLDRLGQRIFASLVSLSSEFSEPSVIAAVQPAPMAQAEPLLQTAADLIPISVVRTLGDLARADVEDVPKLPPEALDRLLSDETALERLTDSGTRQESTGTLLSKLQLPPNQLLPVLNWLNSRLNELVPARQGDQLFAFTRRPHNSAAVQPSPLPENILGEGEKNEATAFGN